MKYLFTLLLAFSLFASCKNAGQNGSSKIPADFSLNIEHTGCRGNCPNYKLGVDANGNAKWYGHHAVEMMGDYTKKLDNKTVKALVATLATYNFFDFDEIYGGGVADIPAVITKVTLNGKTRRVEDIRDAPKGLKEMEAKLESLIGKNGWSKK